MRSLNKNDHGNVQMIIMAVVAGVVLAVAIPIIFSVVGGINTTTIDANLQGTPATNASSSLTSNVGTFFTISPIYLVVLAAVGIISAVMMIMVTRRT